MRYRNGQKQFARSLRADSTEEERQLWQTLRHHLLGARFRRQVAIGPYIVDFACLEKRLVIEVDGSQHADSLSDKERDQWLEQEGFQVLRFWNHEVTGNQEGVLEAIYQKIKELV